MYILITGGAGYIGSHAALQLMDSGYSVILLDNFSASTASALQRLERAAGKHLRFFDCDLRYEEQVAESFYGVNVKAVLHCAGLRAAHLDAECWSPQDCRDNNLTGTRNLLKVMRRKGVKKLLFSSTAAVYGEPAVVPVSEDCPCAPADFDSATVRMQEEMLIEQYHVDPEWSIALLRSFTPVGAHPSGRLGESPGGEPHRLMSSLAQVAEGRRGSVNIYGNDYPTADGTGIRDYIHVLDLAAGYEAALKRIEGQSGLFTYNLGTGKGHSVLEVVDTFERVNGVAVPRQIAPRRPGDIAVRYADTTKTRWELKWRATRTLEDMCRDAWHYQRTTAY